jgi:hypothetical protein
MTQRTKSCVEKVDLWSFVEGAIGFISDVECGGSRLVLTLDNREVCAVVPMGDFQRLQLEDEQKGGSA